jgi:hypothetical protein
LEAHGPAPEQRGALERGTAIGDLLDLPLAAVTADRQDGGAVHREQQRRAVEERDRKRVERIVEEVAVADRESRGPIEVREDAERHAFRPRAHEERPDEADHQEQPDRAGKGPGDVRPHAERAGTTVGASPPQQHRAGQEEAGNLPPATLRQWHEQLESPFGARRLERQPGKLPDELDRIPIDAGPHVEADDLEGKKAADERGEAQLAEVEGADLRGAQLARPIMVFSPTDPRIVARRQRRTEFGRAPQLHLREDILIGTHRIISPLRTRSAS